MRKLIGFVAGLSLALFATAAFAIPVTYTVDPGASFAGGGTLSGTFTYDATTNTYSAINLTTTAGGAYPGETYVAINGAGAFSTASALVAVSAAGNGSGQPVLALTWGAPLTDAGGVVAIGPFSAEGFCDAVCGSFSATPTRALIGGTVTGVAPPAVPTMSEWGLMLMGLVLAAMAYAATRRRFITT